MRDGALVPELSRAPKGTGNRMVKCGLTRPLQLTRPSVAALLRGLAAERQSLVRQ
jgi:hypothetical protein